MNGSVDPTATGVLRRDARYGRWLRENFRLPALFTIAGGFVTASIWIWNQHVDLQDLKKRDPTEQLNRMESQQGQILRQLATLQADMTNVAARVTRQEAQWDRVTQVAEAPLPRRPRSRVIQ
jgi:hypothetical protein